MTSFFAASSGECGRTLSSPMNVGRLRAVEVDQVGEVAELERDVGADLAGFGLHRVGDPLGVVEHPVAQLAEPVVAPLDPHRLPLGLVGAHAGDGRGDRLGRVDVDRVDDRSGRGVEDVDRLGGGRGGAVHRRDRLGARLGSAALHWVLPSSTLGWSANCTRLSGGSSGTVRQEMPRCRRRSWRARPISATRACRSALLVRDLSNRVDSMRVEPCESPSKLVRRQLSISACSSVEPSRLEIAVERGHVAP